MQYEIIVVGSFEVNCIVLWHDQKAWVVDPGADASVILDFLEKRNLKIARVLLTHGHIDHISALDKLLSRHSAPVFIHANDVKWAFSAFNRVPPYLHVPGKPANLHTSILGDGIISEHGLTARIIHTPGHTPGGCCLLFEQEKLLISGDTLFAGSVGRTDLPGGDWPELFASLQKLCQLPDDLTVIPGHGPTTSLGAEKKYNLYLNGEQP